MTKFKRECKSVLATALTIMLVLSMMMGVFTLSASADENNQFPVVLNKPVLVYRDDWYKRYSQNPLTTISIRMDDVDSNQKMSNISTIYSVYDDMEGNIHSESETGWYIADRFGVILVNVHDIVNKYCTPTSPSSYDKDRISEKVTRSEFVEMLKGLGRSSLYLNITYNDGSTQKVDVGVVDQKLVSSTRSTAWETAGSILVRLAHSKLIEQEDFYELNNAIVGVQSVNKDTTNKYYVDIDSEDEVKLPMNEMSEVVELVQTRVGNNVVFNSYGSVDFGGDSIAAVSNGKVDEGTVYYLPNGAYASNDDPCELVNLMYQKGLYFPIGELDGKPINLNHMYDNDVWDINSLYQEIFGDLVERGYFYTNYYQGLTDDVDEEKLNQFANIFIYSMSGHGGNQYTIGMDIETYPGGYELVTNSNGYSSIQNGGNHWGMYSSVTPFVLSFDGNHSSSLRFLANLRSFVQNNMSAPLSQYILKNYFSGRYDTDSSRSSSAQTGKGYGGDQRLFNIAYSYKDTNEVSHITNSYLLSSSDYHTDVANVKSMIDDFEDDSNSRSEENVLCVYFTPADFNQKKAMFIPDEKAYQAYEKLIEIAEASGLEIKYNQSFMPRRDYENCEKLSFKNVITSLGVEIGTAQEQRLRPYPTFYYSSYDTTGETITQGFWDYVSPGKTHALHEDYELVQYGDFVFNKKNSSLPIITDTYYDTLFDDDTENNDNPDPDPEENGEENTQKTREKGIKFNVSDIRSNIRKGVAYNVVNQVQLGYIQSQYPSGTYIGKIVDNTRYEGDYMKQGDWLGFSYTDDKGIKKMFTRGNFYYVGGEFITHTNTVETTDHVHVGWTFDYDGFRNTVYKRAQTQDHSYDDDLGLKDGHDAIMRNTEYKWGELVFVSKPDKVEDLEYKPSKQTLNWTKPVDEGYGITGKNKTAQDDYIKVNEYIIKVSDENGKELYSGSVERTNKNNVSFDIKQLVTKSGVYNVSVTAKNPIGESEPTVLEDVVINLADMEVTMTPDQPVHNSDETVEFKETITNTGKIKLTNLIIYQTAIGEYVPMEGMTVKGTKASIAELDVGKSIDILYRVPASNAKNGILTNTVEVTASDQKLTETAESSVIINEVNSVITVTAAPDKKVYTDDDTVVITAVVENKGTEVLNNITLDNSIEVGTFTDIDPETITATENSNAVVINSMNPGDKVTLTYEIPAKDITAGKNGAVQSIIKAACDKTTAGAMAEFRVIRPSVTIKATPEKTEYRNDENVVYNILIKNTGNIALTNLTVSASIKGTFGETEEGAVATKRDMVIDELAAGKSISLTYEVSSENTTFGTMNNLFTVTANEDASAEADTEIKVAYYGIDVMKTVEEATYVVGDKIVFRTKVTNTGDGELKNIYISEDAEGTFKLAEGAVIYTDDTIVIASLKAGESYTYEYYVDATEDNIKNGTVGGTSSVSIDDEIVGSDSASTKVYTQSMTFKKTVDSEKEYRRGDKVVWTDTVTNTGECDLTNIVITESLVGEFNTEYETTADSVTIPKLAQGESISIEFTSTITPADIVDRTYTCTAEVNAREYLTATDSASVKIVGPALTVGKYSDKNYYAKGERVEFTEVITNSGDITLTNVKVTENLDGRFSQYDKSFTVDGRTLTIPEIAVGDSVVFHYAVDRSLIEGDTIESTTTVTCDQDVNGSAAAVVKVDNTPDNDSANTDTANTDSAKTNTDTVNTDSTSTNTDTANTDSGNTNTDTSGTDSAKTNTDTSGTDSAKTNTDTANTDSAKTNTDTANTDSGKTNTDTANTDSANTNTDTASTDSANTNTDTSGTDSGNTNTDTANTDSGKTNTDTANTDSANTNTDTNNTDSANTNTDSSDNTDSSNVGTDTNTQTDTDTSGKESEDQPTKKHLMGDVDMDGKVTGKDALLIQRYTIGLKKLDPVQLFLADVTNDKKVSAADALNIMRYTIKMHTSSNTGEQVDIPTELLKNEK